MNVLNERLRGEMAIYIYIYSDDIYIIGAYIEFYTKSQQLAAKQSTYFLLQEKVHYQLDIVLLY